MALWKLPGYSLLPVTLQPRVTPTTVHAAVAVSWSANKEGDGMWSGHPAFDSPVGGN